MYESSLNFDGFIIGTIKNSLNVEMMTYIMINKNT
jgi:hypothetical protein